MSSKRCEICNNIIVESLFNSFHCSNCYNKKERQNNETIVKSCSHYKNKIQVFAKCCNKYYDCHLCHNEVNDHKMSRKKIKKIICINCNCENPPSNKCIDCNIVFGRKHCGICNIWCDEIAEMFHCNSCGVCRKGNGNDFYHCNTCDMCFSKSNRNRHNCEKNSFDEVCPICLNSLYHGNDATFLLECDHKIHQKCLNELIDKTDKNKHIPCCMICRKSVVNISKYEKKFDNYIRENPVYNNWKTEISCNDCCQRSITNYHNLFHKCNFCKSYNTSIINVIKE